MCRGRTSPPFAGGGGSFLPEILRMGGMKKTSPPDLSRMGGKHPPHLGGGKVFTTSPSFFGRKNEGEVPKSSKFSPAALTSPHKMRGKSKNPQKFSPAALFLLSPHFMGGQLQKLPPHYGGKVFSTSPPQISPEWGGCCPPDVSRMGGMKTSIPPHNGGGGMSTPDQVITVIG